MNKNKNKQSKSKETYSLLYLHHEENFDDAHNTGSRFEMAYVSLDRAHVAPLSGGTALEEVAHRVGLHGISGTGSRTCGSTLGL